MEMTRILNLGCRRNQKGLPKEMAQWTVEWELGRVKAKGTKCVRVLSVEALITSPDSSKT